MLLIILLPSLSIIVLIIIVVVLKQLLLLVHCMLVIPSLRIIRVPLSRHVSGVCHFFHDHLDPLVLLLVILLSPNDPFIAVLRSRVELLLERTLAPLDDPVLLQGRVLLLVILLRYLILL